MSDAISLDLYDVFVAIAEARSVTAAAKRLRTTKATVSRSLARLEEQVGDAICDREIAVGLEQDRPVGEPARARVARRQVDDRDLLAA